MISNPSVQSCTFKTRYKRFCVFFCPYFYTTLFIIYSWDIYIMYNISTSKIVIIFFLILIIITTKLFPFSFIVSLSSPFLSSSYYISSLTNDPRVRRSKKAFSLVLEFISLTINNHFLFLQQRQVIKSPYCKPIRGDLDLPQGRKVVYGHLQPQTSKKYCIRSLLSISYLNMKCRIPV